MLARLSRHLLATALLTAAVAAAQDDRAATPPAAAPPTEETVKKLLDRLQADEARIKELENKLGAQTTASSAPAAPSSASTAQPAAPSTQKAAATAAQPNTVVSAAVTVPQPVAAAAQNDTTATPQSTTSTASATTAPSILDAPTPDSATADANDPHAHMLELPGGGPVLKIRGFFDFNFGVGTDANPLIFPLGTVHNTFQSGEFDLFMSSKLSEKLSFLSEVVIGSDQTNYWGLDIERLELTYKQSKYFEISGGRYHTSIGYYNTAFHHGTWFQTATGRPFMYFFEDSGGILPVHSVGVSTSGLVPGTDSLGLHWVAEVGNGRNSDPNGQPVQNFLSDRNHKDYNLAAFIAPQWLRGLQVGGSYYRDRMMPAGIPHVEQNIESLYAVYITPTWEFMNEAVAISNRIDGQPFVYHTPLMYTQVSRKFGIYRPYFRYQYVNSPANDPVNIYTGRYMGPSVGLRVDFADYAAFKLQYNRLDQRNVIPANGLDAQVAFTF